jgi:inhibitor of KinA sporulation pathway (predicted exonuclease)
MARLLDQILVIDIEATCWEGQQPPGQTSEIIEVGICPIDATSLERLEKRSIFIKPVRSEVSTFCTRLTSITADMLKDAGSLAEAATLLRKHYRTKDRLWASWGDYDRRMFVRACDEHAVDYPFGVSHLNAKTLFAIAYGLDRELGIDEAHAMLGWKMQGTHHRGDDDAWNIAGLLCMLLKRLRGRAES